jgi:hypothetical protein
MSKYGRKYFLQVHPNFELCINFSGTDNHILEVFRIYRDMEQYYFDDHKFLQIQFNRAGDVRDLSISPDL